MIIVKTFTKKELWQLYEDKVYELLKNIPNAIIKKHPTIKGRAFDFSVEVKVNIPFTELFQAEFPLLLGGDCKKHKRLLDVKDVDSFAGMLEDAGLSIGILVAESGFGQGANRRAKKSGVILLRFPWDLLSLIPTDDDELEDYCISCPAADDDRPMGMIDWDFNKYRSEGYGYMTGQCSTCGTFFIKCFDCGGKTGFFEGDFDKGIICSGGCSRISIVDYERDEISSISVDSYDNLESQILESSISAKQGLTDKQILEIISQTKWQYWTVGDPLIRLREEGLIERINSMTRLTPHGRKVVKKYIENAEDSCYGW